MDWLIPITLLVVGLVFAIRNLGFSIRQANETHVAGTGKNLVCYALRGVLFLNWLVLPPSLLLPFLGAMIFTGGNNLRDWLLYLSLASFPVTIIVAIKVARYFTARGNEGRALSAACLPLLHITASLFVPGIW
jgi:hypothetical protein